MLLHGASSSRRSFRWPSADVLERVAERRVVDLVGRRPDRSPRAASVPSGTYDCCGISEERGVRLHEDLARAPGPEAGDRAHERALAGARLADDQHLLARRDVDVGLVHDRAAVVERDRETAQAERRALGLAAHDPAASTSSCSARSRRSSDASSEAKRRAEPVHSASRGKLSTSQLNEVCTVTNADDACITSPSVISPATYFGAQSSSGRIERNPELTCETVVVRTHCDRSSRQRCSTVAEGPVEPEALLALAAEERDALAVLAHAREPVAIVGLGLVLVLGGRHEAAADDHHRAAHQHRVEDRRDDQESREW